MGNQEETAALRARVAALEEQLRREREAARRHQEALVKVARMTLGPGETGFNEVLCDLAVTAAETLEVERASVWLLSADRQQLSCLELFEREPAKHSSGVVLSAVDYPRYFAALETGRAIDAHDAREDPRTREFTSGYLVPLGITSMLDAAIRHEGRVVGCVCHEHVGQARTWTHEDVEFAGALADQVALIMATVERRKLVADADAARRELRATRELSAIDELTQLYNRREMERLLSEDVERATRTGRRLSVAMLDIDHFKQVNDEHGHLVGDEVLRQAARILMETLRSTDRPARYGGEEFLLILPDTDGADLMALLERVRQAFEQHLFAVEHEGRRLELRLTASIGAASFPRDGDAPLRLVEASDRALYRAKQAGRNRVVQT